jgi:hypothetical protein
MGEMEIGRILHLKTESRNLKLDEPTVDAGPEFDHRPSNSDSRRGRAVRGKWKSDESCISKPKVEILNWTSPPWTPVRDSINVPRIHRLGKIQTKTVPAAEGERSASEAHGPI